MQASMCHVHFPDANKHSDEKSDQVSISGAAEQVDIARSMLRVYLCKISHKEIFYLESLSSSSGDRNTANFIANTSHSKSPYQPDTTRIHHEIIHPC